VRRLVRWAAERAAGVMAAEDEAGAVEDEEAAGAAEADDDEVKARFEGVLMVGFFSSSFSAWRSCVAGFEPSDGRGEKRWWLKRSSLPANGDHRLQQARTCGGELHSSFPAHHKLISQIQSLIQRIMSTSVHSSTMP
jgi:hypothetical protein